MRIVQKPYEPSRDDAMRMTRNERISVLYLMHAVGILENLPKEISERLSMIPDGKERAMKIADDVNSLLNELRLTIPDVQRRGLENTACDFEVRMCPKATPGPTNVVMDKEEFRKLVDFSREHCLDCVDDDVECEQCSLYQLLTSILPIDNYNSICMCPYNLGEWKN